MIKRKTIGHFEYTFDRVFAENYLIINIVTCTVNAVRFMDILLIKRVVGECTKSENIWTAIFKQIQYDGHIGKELVKVFV